MTKQEVGVLAAYVRQVGDLMGLRDWHFRTTVTDDLHEGGMENPDKDTFMAMASVLPVPGQHKAQIRFSSLFREDNDAETQREIVVHELVHCHLADMREFVRTGTLHHLAQATYDALSFGFDLAWEHTVDDISRAWAENLPFIHWPKKGTR